MSQKPMFSQPREPCRPAYCRIRRSAMWYCVRATIQKSCFLIPRALGLSRLGRLLHRGDDSGGYPHMALQRRHHGCNCGGMAAPRRKRTASRGSRCGDPDEVFSRAGSWRELGLPITFEVVPAPFPACMIAV